jgi:hypothetical protein
MEDYYGGMERDELVELMKEYVGEYLSGEGLTEAVSLRRRCADISIAISLLEEECQFAMLQRIFIYMIENGYLTDIQCRRYSPHLERYRTIDIEPTLEDVPPECYDIRDLIDDLDDRLKQAILQADVILSVEKIEEVTEKAAEENNK